MRYRTPTFMLMLLTVMVLAGCGTTQINQQALEAHDRQVQAAYSQASAHQAQTAAMAANCRDDMCVVAVALAGVLGQPQINVAAPQLRSPGEEFARGFAPVASLASTGMQVWGAGWLVDRAGRNSVDLVNAMGSVVGQVQGPVDHSITVGGNYGPTRGDEWNAGGNIGDTDHSVGRDQIGRDQRLGDDTTGSCIGESCRNQSPGPIDSHNQPTPPTDTEPDPDPDP